MQIKYLSFDGLYFDTPEGCLRHEQENPCFKMWNEHGIVTSPESARVVWLSSNGGAKAFMKLCNEEETTIDGISECSTGTFIWNDEYFVWAPLENETMQAVRLYFENTK